MIYEDVLEEAYEVAGTKTPDEIIRDPGKFVGGTVATVYYYFLVLDGFYHGKNYRGMYYFRIDDDERKYFGFRRGNKYITIYETNYGVVYLIEGKIK